MAKSLDLTGQKFGKLIVLSKFPNRGNNGSILWTCICYCGKLITTSTKCLRGDNTKSCGKCMAPEQVILNSILSDYKKSARNKNLDWKLTDEEVFLILAKNCKYCDKIPSLIKHHRRHKNIYIKYNGIDRVDNSLGYIEGNTVPCCWDCNFIKSNLPIEDFLKLINKIGIKQGFI